MRNVRVARRYAQALMTVVEEAGILEQTAAEIQLIGQTVKESRELQLFLMSPIIPLLRKRTVMRALFASRVGTTTMAFLELLVTKQRERLLGDVADQFMALRDEKQGIVEVHVTSAVPMTSEQEQMLANEMRQFTQKAVRPRMYVDPRIRGGLIIRVGDTLLDGSVVHQLEILRGRFAESGPATH
jgi:F-type H+-transporting ATPase subunit delta